MHRKNEPIFFSKMSSSENLRNRKRKSIQQNLQKLLIIILRRITTISHPSGWKKKMWKAHRDKNCWNPTEHKSKIEESARTLNRNNKRMKFKRTIRKRGLTE